MSPSNSFSFLLRGDAPSRWIRAATIFGFNTSPSSSATWIGRIRCCVKIAWNTLLPAATIADWNKNAGGIKAFYFKDPDGHPVEILEFPADKGDPKWHRRTAASSRNRPHCDRRFRHRSKPEVLPRLLGLGIAGESENYGTEQEHLNNVFGARLRITALRAPVGPGIELLEYLSPATGGRIRPTSAPTIWCTGKRNWKRMMRTAPSLPFAWRRAASCPRGASRSLVGRLVSHAGLSSATRMVMHLASCNPESED